MIKVEKEKSINPKKRFKQRQNQHSVSLPQAKSAPGKRNITGQLRGGGTSRLLIEGRLAHHSVLACHPSTKSTLDLSPESQLIEVIRLLSRGHESLRLEGFIFKALQAIAEVGDITGSRVASREATGGAIGGGQRGAAADG